VIIIERPPVFFAHPFFFGHRFFARPFFFGHRFFVHPFFFRHRFFTFGAPLFLGGSAATVIDTPFFCDVDGLGFPDLAAFAQHLHDAHGIALDRALSFCEPVAGRCVFFGSE
jgi:hypothetical protein